MDAWLEQMAEKYLWWEPPERAIERQDLLLCQMMQLGTWDDVWMARKRFGDEAFKRALGRAPPGVLDRRSWKFWNLFYGRSPIPPLPERSFG